MYIWALDCSIECILVSQTILKKGVPSQGITVVLCLDPTRATAWHKNGHLWFFTLTFHSSTMNHDRTNSACASLDAIPIPKCPTRKRTSWHINTHQSAVRAQTSLRWRSLASRNQGRELYALLSSNGLSAPLERFVKSLHRF